MQKVQKCNFLLPFKEIVADRLTNGRDREEEGTLPTDREVTLPIILLPTISITITMYSLTSSDPSSLTRPFITASTL